MVAEQTEPAVSFKGTKEQKALAERAFQVLRAKGMFSSSYAPIRASLSSLQEYLASGSDGRPDAVRKAIAANDEIFVLATEDEEEYVITSRLGTPPVEMQADTRHTFPARFMTPEPAPERPLRTEKPVPQIVVNAEIADEISDTRDEVASVERELAKLDGIVPPAERERGDVTMELVSRDEIPVAESLDEAAPETAEAADIDMAEEGAAPVAAEASQTEPVDAEAAPAAEEPLPEPPSQPERRDFSDIGDEALAATVLSTLRADARFANFGDQWMAEEQVSRLSRGNLRRITDDINEQERPLTDEVLAQDVLGARRSSPDFARLRFAVNYRLASERGFEFLGTRDQPFWGTTDLTAIGTTRRKATEIGTDYRYLIEEAPLGSVAPRSATAIEHTLSFYEFTYGLLPLGEKMQSLLPAPVMPDQRAAVLTVEIPQFENSVYLVEVRYPTQTRGGFLLGLDDFYEEKLVPGAMLSIEATDNDGHYKIEYLEDDEHQDRFLELDDRRAAKYVFRPLTYDTAVSEEWLVTESRFPAFGSEKPLSERKRRRIEDVIEATFERIGEKDGTTRLASFNDLLVAVNIGRPASTTTLRAAIESMASVTDDGSGILTHDTAS